MCDNLDEVMKTSKNGKTQKIPRRSINSFDSHSSDGLGEIKDASRVHGTYTDRPNFDDCSGENFASPSNGGNCTAGKILARLKQLESEYLLYIIEHKEMFEARLEESKKRESSFKQSIQQLEQDIQRLMSGED
jgi:hypothetical protein